MYSELTGGQKAGGTAQEGEGEEEGGRKEYQKEAKGKHGSLRLLVK